MVLLNEIILQKMKKMTNWNITSTAGQAMFAGVSVFCLPR
jgi:hypothetical protein